MCSSSGALTSFRISLKPSKATPLTNGRFSTKLRSCAPPRALPSDDIAGRARAEGALSLALGKLVALAENYPDLKASGNFLDLQQQLSQLENELQMARRYYNGAVRNQNVLVQSFPGNLIAGLFGFRQRDYFELSSDAERTVPQVGFAAGQAPQ